MILDDSSGTWSSGSMRDQFAKLASINKTVAQKLRPTGCEYSNRSDAINFSLAEALCLRNEIASGKALDLFQCWVDDIMVDDEFIRQQLSPVDFRIFECACWQNIEFGS